MTHTPLFSLVAALLVTPMAACSGSRLLVGETPPGAAGRGVLPDAGPGDTAGPSEGIAGTGSVTRVVTPLRIGALEALTRIAAVLLQDKPDADLVLQANQGHFTSTDDLYGAVHQMLIDPRAARGVGAFYRWWLKLDDVAGLTKDAALFPELTAALKADMASETETFGVNVTLAMNGDYGALVTAPFSFINERLAGIYGIPNVTGDALREVSLDPAQRAGLLTQPAMAALASHPASNEPSGRGTHILRDFLCTAVPTEPPGTLAFTPRAPGISMRQALAENVSNPTCAPCHAHIDPPGLAFESFDAIGRWRTTDNGVPVDVSGLTVIDVLPSAVVVDGPVQLAQTLARSDAARRCMASQWLAFALGKRPVAELDTKLDETLVNRTMNAFRSSGFNLKELITAVLTSDTFLAP